MSNLQPNCCLEFDFRKVDEHAGGKWLNFDVCFKCIFIKRQFDFYQTLTCVSNGPIDTNSSPPSAAYMRQ